MKPDKRSGPDIAKASRAGNTDASNVKSDDTTVIRFPRGKWVVPMALARRIARTPPPLKPAAVRRWRVSVQAALGVEVRP